MSAPRPLLVIGNYNYSSWSLRAWLPLARSGLDFDVERIVLDQPDTGERIRRFSDAGRVPVLVDGDLHVWDSLAIAEHLAERAPAAELWPVDPAARAWARSISAEMHAGFAALRSELPMNIRARDRRVTPSAAARGDIERILGIWTESVARFGDRGPWLCGNFSIADAFYAPVAMRFLTYGVQVPELAWSWVDTLLADADMTRWIEQALAEGEVLPIEEVGDGGTG